MFIKQSLTVHKNLSKPLNVFELSNFSTPSIWNSQRNHSKNKRLEKVRREIHYHRDTAICLKVPHKTLSFKRKALNRSNSILCRERKPFCTHDCVFWEPKIRLAVKPMKGIIRNLSRLQQRELIYSFPLYHVRIRMPPSTSPRRQQSIKATIMCDEASNFSAESWMAAQPLNH